MVAGYDPSGPALYYVDSDGQRTKGQIFSVGSGSLYAYGVLDAGYKWCAFSLSASCTLKLRFSFWLHRDHSSVGWSTSAGFSCEGCL